jgi:signal transduction histidine kinase
VRRIVEGHGGRVTLDSAPAEGTRVRIVLPVRTLETAEAAAVRA